MRFLLVALAALPLGAACRSAPMRASLPVPVTTQGCYEPTEEDFRVTIVPGVAFADSAYLRRMLGLVVQRFEVPLPIPRRSMSVGATLRRDGSVTDVRLVRRSWYRDMDQRAERAMQRFAADDLLDSLPAGFSADSLADSLPVVVHFGAPTTEGAVAQIWLSVQKPPMPHMENLLPNYPAELAGTGLRGRVIAVFTVDSAGGVVPGSIRTDSATHPAFAQAVLEVLPHWRFEPAHVRGCRVGREVRYPFEFGT